MSERVAESVSGSSPRTIVCMERAISFGPRPMAAQCSISATRLPPTPSPKSSRPWAMMSTVAAIFANRVGERRRLLVTMTPRRSRLV
jgi:hypothetical protein